MSRHAYAWLGSAAVLLVIVVAGAAARASQPKEGRDSTDAVVAHATRLFADGQRIFRYDTFGDEAFWGDTLRLQDAIKGARLGGVGPGVSPAAALAVGLKVDIDAVPPDIQAAIASGRVRVDLNDPASTVALLQADAVVGLKGIFDGSRLTSLGVQCSFCHSTVDDAVAPGIGHRLDGWPNRDLNVGAIVNLSPDLSVPRSLLGIDDRTLRAVLSSWGPGKFDPAVFLDGKAFRPDGGSAAVMIPPAFGLAGVNLHTSTGWGGVSHWNAFVANLEMHGQGIFYDPRLNDAERFPIAARNGFGNLRNIPDLITPKLPALQFYQLALPAPRPAAGTFNPPLAEEGKAVFNGRAGCATCHVPPIFTEPGWNMHTPAEIGIDDFQAQRSPDQRYRTTPLAGLFTRLKGGFYHDGRFKSYDAVVDHYDTTFGLRLSTRERAALVEYLKSL